jgi:hypothetical protein
MAGLAVLLAASRPSRADTRITGGNLGGQVWTAEGGPYHVSDGDGAPTVASGQELRIEAGTMVLFSSDAQTAIAPRLTVEGRLTIAGTTAEPVVMQPDAASGITSWGGIYVTSEEPVAIAGAVIRSAGEGITIHGAQVNVDRTTLEGCTLGMVVWQGTHTFDSMTFRNNGVGLELQGDHLAGSPVTVTNALVQGNTMHGLLTQGISPLTVINCTVDGNRSGISAWYVAQGSAPLTLDVQNTIFSNNRFAIDLDAGGPPSSLSTTVTQSTFWGNGMNSRFTNAPGGTTISIAANDAPAGDGNGVVDPQYVSATDLHLTPSSPCIDSASAARAPDHDLDGNPRPVEGDRTADTDGSSFDRGAYELVPGSGNGGGGGSVGAGGGVDIGGSGGGAGGAVSGGGGSGYTPRHDEGCACAPAGAGGPSWSDLLGVAAVLAATRRRRAGSGGAPVAPGLRWRT